MTDPPDRLIDSLADRYTIERELGRGGMATVYLAEDLKHQRKVAIKVLRPELAATLGADRFLREIQIAAKLTHPHILALYDSGEAAGFLYYVMPYIEGESLRDRLRRERQLPIDDSVRITREVAAALSHAHGLGVVHRDIKPENILLSAGEAVVADFGIARAVSAAGGDQLTETGMAVGTPAYMSPEQATADEVDGRSDIYSLGCVLYEMLGGDPPYLGSTPKAVLARKLTEPVPGLRALRETVPPALEQAVQKALAKAPADRFQTATAFAEALTHPVITAPSQQVATQESRPFPRTALAIVALLLILIGGWWAINRIISRGDPIERLVVLPPTNLMRDSTQDFFMDGIHDELIARLNQIPGLDVISRTSAVRYRNTDKTTPEIARELNVDAVLESSVLWSGDSVRIQVQLIDAFPQERHLWAETYDEPYGEIRELHSRIALAVADQVHVTLRSAQRAELADVRPVNPAAHEALLRAKHLTSTYDVVQVRQAIVLLEQAIATDTSYAEAYAQLADAYDTRGFWFGDLAPLEAYPLALNAVNKALQIDSSLALAHKALGNIRKNFLWDWPGAESAFRKALDLDPSSADAHANFANHLRMLGRNDEGLIHIERAVELNPFSPMTVAELGMFYREFNQPDSAEAAIRRVIELDPEFSVAYWVLGLWRWQDGDFDGAIDMLEQAAGYPGADELRAVVYAGSGEAARARVLLDSLVQRPKPELVTIGIAYAALGEDDLALASLERGFRERSPMMAALRNVVRVESSPLYRLRMHPRLQEVLRRIELPPLEEP